MRIKHSQILAYFWTNLSHSFSGRSGPKDRSGKYWWSGPEGPQFARSIGTLMPMSQPKEF